MSKLDDDLVHKVLSTNARFAALWDGDVDMLAVFFPSNSAEQPFDHSRADSSLMRHLAFLLDEDPARMETQFRRSSLMRLKFENADYRDHLISEAIKFVGAV